MATKKKELSETVKRKIKEDRKHKTKMSLMKKRGKGQRSKATKKLLKGV